MSVPLTTKQTYMLPLEGPFKVYR